MDSLAESAPVGSRCRIEQSPDDHAVEPALTGQPLSSLVVRRIDVDPGFALPGGDVV
jgi:hypothetical protein